LAKAPRLDILPSRNRQEATRLHVNSYSYILLKKIAISRAKSSGPALWHVASGIASSIGRQPRLDILPSRNRQEATRLHVNSYSYILLKKIAISRAKSSGPALWHGVRDGLHEFCWPRASLAWTFYLVGIARKPPDCMLIATHTFCSKKSQSPGLNRQVLRSGTWRRGWT
jgi:hypothetical protein